ncbi:MAG: hypothetical protein JWN48_3250 [Myxococcaceae bacterium]|nr:hypothetical protein [Myxococcaceae bacterium]
MRSDPVAIIDVALALSAALGSIVHLFVVLRARRSGGRDLTS